MKSKIMARWIAGVVVAALCVGALPFAADATSGTSRVDPELLAAAKAHPDTTFSVIVRAAAVKVLPQTSNAQNSHRDDNDNESRAKRADAIFGSQNGAGAIRRKLGIVGAAAGPLRGSQIVVLAKSPLIERIIWDERLPVAWTAPEAALAATSAGIQAVNAPAAWSTLGASGRGIGIAVIDSGVADHPDLAGRIVARVDLTGENSTGDPGGHGTHVAGLVAGDGTASHGAFTGVAPQANIVSVRVIDATGHATLSTIFSGMHWVLNNRSTYNIRVVNMSFGGTVRSSYADDLLASAAEILNFAGIVTVVSAGNGGSGASTITSPGSDPFVITVGADDDAGTATLLDDSVPVWSSRGPTAFDGIAKPDLIAPGRRLVSLRAAGSTIDTLYPERRVTVPGATDATYFTMSGTSMSAPIVAGIAALYLEQNPQAKPRAVKQQLAATAHALPGVAATDQGAGVVDALAALTTQGVPMVYTRYPVSHAFADQMYAKVKGQALMWRDPLFHGGVDSHGITWAGITWDSITWDAITWENLTWEAFTWETVTWTDITWSSTTWEGLTWDGLTSETTGIGWTAVY